ncbi:MAG: HAD-IIIC family phosphatase [Ruminococcaceae bacterium]|nr:HAD-IIIC family phosphatase [Oscillospiraceae bacterium]
MAREAKIKCLVFDLDSTLWQGVLSEGGGDELIPGMKEFILELDKRGIVMSIASKNEESAALKNLRRFGLEEYFLCPEIGWGAKSESVKNIISSLGIKEGSVGFIDDNPFERDEVAFALPDVRTYDAAEFEDLLTLDEFCPTFITEDAKNRRNMYRADFARKKDEQSFGGSTEEFLMTLGMKLRISRVSEEDLRRVHELTLRTHQLNSTGYTYDFDELRAFIDSPDHIFIIASLEDKYGDSGKVGIILLQKQDGAYLLKLLIVSCRVMSRGVGTALLVHAVRLAKNNGARLLAEFKETEHNRIMYITYKMMGFEDIGEDGDELLLEYMDEALPEYPPYLHLEI